MQAKTKRVQYVMTYIKENTNMNEHRKVIVKLNNKNISKSAYRDHRNSRTRTLAASRDIADLWRSKMVPTKRQNNGGSGDQLTRANC